MGGGSSCWAFELAETLSCRNYVDPLFFLLVVVLLLLSKPECAASDAGDGGARAIATTATAEFGVDQRCPPLMKGVSRHAARGSSDFCEERGTGSVIADGEEVTLSERKQRPLDVAVGVSVCAAGTCMDSPGCCFCASLVAARAVVMRRSVRVVKGRRMGRSGQRQQQQRRTRYVFVCEGLALKTIESDSDEEVLEQQYKSHISTNRKEITRHKDLGKNLGPRKNGLQNDSRSNI